MLTLHILLLLLFLLLTNCTWHSTASSPPPFIVRIRSPTGQIVRLPAPTGASTTIGTIKSLANVSQPLCPVTSTTPLNDNDTLEANDLKHGCLLVTPAVGAAGAAPPAAPGGGGGRGAGGGGGGGAGAGGGTIQTLLTRGCVLIPVEKEKLFVSILSACESATLLLLNSPPSIVRP